VVADGDFHDQIVCIAGVAIAQNLYALMAEPFTASRRGTALIPGRL